MASVLAKVPPPGEVLGLGRRESIYDTQVHADGAPLGNVILFTNFGAWSATGFTTTTKTFGRDCNLTGISSFLPTGYKFGAYRWRIRSHSLDDDACDALNLISFAEIRMLRNMGYAVLKNDQSPYITAQLNDLTSWSDNERLAVADPSIPNAIPTIGHNHEGRVLDVNGQPFVLSALQNWSVEINVPVARAATPNFEPTIPIYDTGTFDGVLIRPAN